MLEALLAEKRKAVEDRLLAEKRKAAEDQLLAETRKAAEDRLLAALKAPLPTAGSGGQAPAEGLAALGFHKGQPVAAIVIFRYCLDSNAFGADRTSIFDRIGAVIQEQVEHGREDINCLSYWLSVTATLLHMLSLHTKPASGDPKRSSGAASSDTAAGSFGSATRSILRTMFGPRASPQNLASTHGNSQAVEAKYPALLFKEHMDAFVQTIFPKIRDNLRKTIAPMLKDCIAMSPAAGGQRAGSQEAWTDVLDVLTKGLGVVKANHVPKILVQELIKQLLRFVNVQLFNQLLLSPEGCSFSNGAYIQAGLGQVAAWIEGAGADLTAGSWEELTPLRQAVKFVVLKNKPTKSLERIMDLCPALSVQQLYRIATMVKDDQGITGTVSENVLGRMKQVMEESGSSASHSFLLDNDSSLPFQTAKLLMGGMDDEGLYDAIPVPEALAEGDGAASFAFLEKELRLWQEV
ncbi:hypothetical protein HYH03_012315 [Edaphochlamys debaryana]|uniref:Dilute domain-containing protein n=1 Tax=Edaphochlamys debaryana TaxID=47281 RepID=A0A835XSS7_9CHLO|nr:hypothetical protein HYH03_012315 [Edaphochlamys debaryana]|eukprot:KAG2489089.1 hypothetical protein HYH03_012315 [Edaphochlamys debaryana]